MALKKYLGFFGPRLQSEEVKLHLQSCIYDKFLECDLGGWGEGGMFGEEASLPPPLDRQNPDHGVGTAECTVV